jgi:hypothetical protein
MMIIPLNPCDFLWWCGLRSRRLVALPVAGFVRAFVADRSLPVAVDPGAASGVDSAWLPRWRRSGESRRPLLLSNFFVLTQPTYFVNLEYALVPPARQSNLVTLSWQDFA